jgi:glyoxylase-like metal-dependent hydrolase (beta-lactamase superfamily II)
MIEIQVNERVLVYTVGGDSVANAFGANAVVVKGADGLLLVDTLGNPVHAQQVEQLLRRHTDAPIRYIVITHHHTDHCLGASWFARHGAPIICQEDGSKLMALETPELIERRLKVPELRPLFAEARTMEPDVTFREGLDLRLGRLPIEVRSMEGGHTGGDCYLYLPTERLLICGDLLFLDYHFNYEHASMDTVRSPLAVFERLGAEVLIPGHGRPTGPRGLDVQRHYHGTVESIVSEGLDAQVDMGEIIARLKAVFPEHQLADALPFAIESVKRARRRAPRAEAQE